MRYILIGLIVGSVGVASINLESYTTLNQKASTDALNTPQGSLLIQPASGNSTLQSLSSNNRIEVL